MSETLELKKTVNLPKTNFAQKANLGASEPARLKKWTDARLYRMISEARKGAEKFILHDGPPYANADIHIGTALNKILKDFVVKTHSMMGFDAPYVPGYDCHGLPIETLVEKKLAAKGKNKNDLPVAAFRRICREHAATAMNGQTRDFSRLGILGEWETPYLTMSPEYESETARLFGRFLERGYVYKGLRPVYWCIHDQTALAEAEVEYKLHTSPSIYVKFPLLNDPAELDEKLAGKKVSLVIWTTTPWTLPANLGIAVHPDFEYAAVEHDDEVLIVASELVGFVIVKCGIGGTNEEGERLIPPILAKFPGSRLKGMKAKHPWIDRESLVMTGEHVTLGGEADAETEIDVSEARNRSETSKAGTGLVHTAPGHGHDDFVIGKEYGLEIYCPVDSAGRFTDEVEHFAGENIFKANAQIVELMRGNGSLLFAENYEHRYPHCWRCKKPVIFRATPQWFISMDEAAKAGAPKSLRAAALQQVEQVRWHPAWGEGRMANMIKGRPDWCVSRQRSWGVPIPVFYCQACDEAIADPQIINHVADIFARETADAWYARPESELLPEGFTCPKCNSADFRKETDILDVWFDSGSSCVAVLETRDNLRFPADVYLEGGDQYRGWFNSSLMCGLAAHDTAPYKQVITHGWVVDGEGKKQSKSIGNVTSPIEIINQSGADVLRLWAAAVDYTEDVRCSGEILQRVTDAYRKFRNTLRYALGNLDGFNPETDAVENPLLQYAGGKETGEIEKLLETDRWALANLDEVTAKVVAAYEIYDFQTAYQTLYNFVTVTLSARYFDIIKDRLYIFAPKSLERRSAQTALYEITDRLCRLLAPILVFTADEAFENLPHQKLASVHLAVFPKASGTDNAQLSADWERIFSIRDEVLKALEEARERKEIGSGLEAKVVLKTDKETTRFLLPYYEDLRYIFIVSQVEVHEDEGFGVQIQKADGAKCERCWNYSVRVGESEKYPTVCERCLAALVEIEKTESATA
jgi:isoleucyl-tRNA synthetase